MAVYYSVSVNAKLTCNCKAYKFPHLPSRDLCIEKIPDLLSVLDVRISPIGKSRIKKYLNKEIFD